MLHRKGLSTFGDRFYSQTARVVAVICLVVASLTYVIGQMKGVGVAFSRFFTVPKVREARSSAGWALVFIAILYATAPAVGAIGALINFIVALTISSFTAPPPEHIQHLVEDIRVPMGSGGAGGH
jgi:cation/acetate symporter